MRCISAPHGVIPRMPATRFPSKKLTLEQNVAKPTGYLLRMSVMLIGHRCVLEHPLQLLPELLFGVLVNANGMFKPFQQHLSLGSRTAAFAETFPECAAGELRWFELVRRSAPLELAALRSVRASEASCIHNRVLLICCCSLWRNSLSSPFQPPCSWMSAPARLCSSAVAQ